MSRGDSRRDHNANPLVPRAYSPPAGNLLNAAAVCERFGITRTVFDYRQQHGWASLGYKTLRPHAQRLPYYGRSENTFLETEVEAAGSSDPFPAASDPRALGWVNDFTYRDARGEWLTLRGAALEFPELPQVSLKRWARNLCRFLTDAVGRRRKISSRTVRPPSRRAVSKVRIYLKADLSELNGARAKGGPAAVFEDGQGRWLTQRQAQEIHGAPLEFCRGWARRDSVRRPGQKALRSKEIPNPVRQKGSPGIVTVFLEGDLLNILAGREGKFPGTGTGVNAARLRAEKSEKARQFLQSTLPDGQQQVPADVLAAAKQEHGINPSYIRRAFKLLRGQVARGGRKGQGGLTYLWRLPPGSKQAPRNGHSPQAAHVAGAAATQTERTERAATERAPIADPPCYDQRLRHVHPEAAAALAAALAPALVVKSERRGQASTGEKPPRGTERKILEMLSCERLQHAEIARRLELSPDYTRQVLGGMVKKGWLDNNREEGYGRVTLQ